MSAVITETCNVPTCDGTFRGTIDEWKAWHDAHAAQCPTPLLDAVRERVEKRGAVKGLRWAAKQWWDSAAVGQAEALDLATAQCLEDLATQIESGEVTP